MTSNFPMISTTNDCSVSIIRKISNLPNYYQYGTIPCLIVANPPQLNTLEFERFTNEAGSNSFVFSRQRWIELAGVGARLSPGAGEGKERL